MVTLKMECVSYSETLVSTYTTTQLHNSQEHHRHLHCRENIISQKM